MNASELRPGDWFIWCDRVVRVERIQRYKYLQRRPSRYLFVRLDDKQLRLHYYDDEQMTVNQSSLTYVTVKGA